MPISFARYCQHCGAPTEVRVPPHDSRERAICTGCGHVHYAGPQLLVLVAVFAEDRLLLLRRGQEPYKGMLAVPGGYVEADESLETAAIRETREEVGLELERADLLPLATLSLPFLNQLHVAFIARLPRIRPLLPAAPEVLDAGWYRKSEVPMEQVWAPAHDFDLDLIFDRACSDRFDFYQRTDESMRMISDGSRITHIWPQPPVR